MTNSILKEVCLSTFLAIGLGAAILGYSLNFELTNFYEELVGVISTILPSILMAKWLFQRCLRWKSYHEAKIVAVTFGMFNPIAIVINFPLAQFFGSYFAFLGSRLGIFGSLLTLFAGVTILSYAACLLALRAARRNPI